MIDDGHDGHFRIDSQLRGPSAYADLSAAVALGHGFRIFVLMIVHRCVLHGVPRSLDESLEEL